MNVIYSGDDVRYSKERILEFLADLEAGNQSIGVAIDKYVKKLKELHDAALKLENSIYHYLSAVNSYAHGYAEYLKKGDDETGTNQQGTDQQDSD